MSVIPGCFMWKVMRDWPGNKLKSQVNTVLNSYKDWKVVEKTVKKSSSVKAISDEKTKPKCKIQQNGYYF